jgi:hypothetical protein
MSREIEQFVKSMRTLIGFFAANKSNASVVVSGSYILTSIPYPIWLYLLLYALFLLYAGYSEKHRAKILAKITTLSPVLLFLNRAGNSFEQTIGMRIPGYSPDEDISWGEFLFVVIGLIQSITYLYYSPIHSNAAKQPF